MSLNDLTLNIHAAVHLRRDSKARQVVTQRRAGRTVFFADEIAAKEYGMEVLIDADYIDELAADPAFVVNPKAMDLLVPF